jgi:phosphate/sulfate permease
MTLDSTQTSSNFTSAPAQTSSLAIISMVSGIASWIILPVLGALIAVITGHLAKKEIRESAGRLTGEEMANAGLVLGYIHLALSIVAICLVTLIIAGVFAFLISSVQWSSGTIQIIP